MTPREFIEKWGPGGPAYGLSERAGAQPHFMDLCEVLGETTPGDKDNYCFERGVTKTGSGRGFADVWKRAHFAWEYKAPGKSLDGALKQLMMYALPLESPPLLVVSDRLRIEIHTHFTGTPSERHVLLLEEITRPEVQEKLRWLFRAPDRFKPAKSNKEITEEAASAFAGTADRLRVSGVSPEQVSHFLTQCLFCFFAEDVGLLPSRLFERLVGVQIAPNKLRAQLERLFESMRDGGLFGVDDIPWFNGGLFAAINVPTLTVEDVKALQVASGLNWSAIDPSIFGTLFERGLEPSKRSQLGAHYTDPSTIMRLVTPVVEFPLLQEWQRVAESIEALLAKRDALRASAEAIPAKTKADKDKFARIRTQANEAERSAQRAFYLYLEKLREFKVLDPACGSGNFLYLALKALKDVEHKVNLDAEALGLQRQHDVTGPHNVAGIEINEYAAELARVTVWIGELQWRIQHGYTFKSDPVLEPLDCIEHRDAVMNADGTEASWPAASVVIGNPPFVGDKKMRAELGAGYTETLRKRFKDRVPGGADFVCYWFEKARAQIAHAGLGAAGLVATNSIRGGRNRQVLDSIVGSTRIFTAWSDEPWVNDGAAVRVSLVCFGQREGATLDGDAIAGIAADLTPIDGDGHALTSAAALRDNDGGAFQGPTKGGPFDITGEDARRMLLTPSTGGASNVDVVRRWFNGDAITGRWPDAWILDFNGKPLSAAQLYDAPFAYIEKHVKPVRDQSPEKGMRERYWLFKRSGEDAKRALRPLSRFIVTPEVSKHRVFPWLTRGDSPDKNLVAIARSDDATFGVLHSRFHTVWALKLGTSLEDRPRYTSTTTFRTFPFPAGLCPAKTVSQEVEVLADGSSIPRGMTAEARTPAEAVARAAGRLVTLRDGWLNPPAWIKDDPEIVPCGMRESPFAPRIVAREGHEEQLAARTLTKLYNEMPAWLKAAHEALDLAVASSYGWNNYSPATSDTDILQRLLALNHARVEAKAAAQVAT